ncbi:hypothetical protein BJV74DRAFT_889431 [Russula compacta]|nr:hypothetical protein BJV74DRAFT_889431 [Russula compacta]
MFNTLVEHVLEQLEDEKAIQALADGQMKSTAAASSSGGDTEMESDEDSDLEPKSTTPPPTFMDQTCNKEFTFRATLPCQVDPQMNGGSLKCPKGHPNGPTLAPSPKKKCIWIMTTKEPPPPFALDTCSNLPAKLQRVGQDVFRGPASDELSVFEGGHDPEIDAEDRSAHKDIVEETTAHLEAGTFASAITLDTKLGTLCNQSVGWIAKAIQDVNRKDLIMKAFEMCHVGNFNCSQASLTSLDALTALRNLPKSNPTLYKQFTGKCEDIPTADGEEEPTFFEGEEIDDDSDIPMEVIRSQVMENGLGQGFETNEEGQIERNGIAEDIEAKITILAVLLMGCGQRTKTASTWYTSAWEQS